MRFKRCMFLTLILFLTIFSISFVVASENVTYDQNTGELNTLSMSDASPIRETSNTLAVDSIDEASYNSLGTDSEEDEIEIDYNNETNLLRSSNDVEIYNDDNIIGAENGKNILGAVNDLEIDNNSLIVLGAEKDLEILGAIAKHTTGAPDMTMLEKIVFVADYIEPGRNKAAHLDELRRLAFENIDLTVLMILNQTLEYLTTTDSVIDQQTVLTRDYYSELLRSSSHE